MKQTYRINSKIRRKGHAALDYNRIELKSEDYDDDVEFCAAIASELLEILTADREYLMGREDVDNDND